MNGKLTSPWQSGTTICGTRNDFYWHAANSRHLEKSAMGIIIIFCRQYLVFCIIFSLWNNCLLHMHIALKSDAGTSGRFLAQRSYKVTDPLEKSFMTIRVL